MKSGVRFRRDDALRTRRWSAPCAFAVAVLHSAGAWSVTEVTPYASYKVEYDDNLFRESDGTGGDRSDTSHTYEAGVGGQYSFGQQSMFLNGFANKTEFRRFDEISYEGYRYDGGLNWRLMPTLGGTFSGGESLSLEDFSNLGGSNERSLVDNSSLSASLAWRVANDYEISPRADQTRTRHSSENSRSSDRDDDGVAIAIRYVGRSNGSIGVEWAARDSDFIRRSPAPGLVEEAEQMTIQMVGTWIPSAVTSINFGLGSTRRDNKGIDVDDNSGVIGSLNLQRTFSVKTSGYVGLTRSISSADDQNESTVTVVGLNAGLNWQATPTIRLGTTYLRQNEDFGDSPLVSAGDREDRLQSIGASATYGPRPWISIRAGLGWQDRTSNVDGADFDSYNASLALRLQYPIR